MTVVLADFVPSSLLFAVIVYAPDVVELNVAVRPLGARVPVVGAALQVTPPLQLPEELTVALRLDA